MNNPISRDDQDRCGGGERRLSHLPHHFELTTLGGSRFSRHECRERRIRAHPTEVVQIRGVETVILRPYGIGITRPWVRVGRDQPAAKEVLLWVGKTFGWTRSEAKQPKRRVVQTEA